jgi:hypothetical protein
LRRIFGPKRDEVTGEWRKLHNEELNDLYVEEWVRQTQQLMYYNNTISWKNACITIV